MTIREIQNTFGVTWTDRTEDVDIIIREYWEGFKKLFPNCELYNFEKWISENNLNGWEDTLDYNSAGRRELKMLYNTIRITKPKKILEIGTHKGCSTEHILLACKNNDSEGYPCEVQTIDIFDYPDTNISNIYPVKRIIGNSLDFLMDNNSYDFIVQDGNHDREHVIKEINLFKTIKTLKTVWSHDYYLDNQTIGKILEQKEYNIFVNKEAFKENNYIAGFQIGLI
jgi:hypothetical protein